MKKTTLICGMGLILASGLIWRFKTHSSSSILLVASDSGEVEHAAGPEIPPAQNDYQAPANIDSIPSLIPTPADGGLAEAIIWHIQTALATGEMADQDLVYTNLLPALAKMKPAAAAQLAVSLAPGPVRTEMLRIVAETWALLNPAAAENWATQLPDTEDRIWSLTIVATEIANTDPAQAVRLTEQFGLGEHTGVMQQNFVQQWAGQDFSAAKTWAETRPAGEQRDNLLARIAFVQSTTDPVEAAAFVVEQIPPGPIQTEAAMSIVHQWAMSDSDGATSWVNLFPPGPLQERAKNELAGIAAWRQGRNTN